MIQQYFSEKEQEVLNQPSVVNVSFNSTATDEDRGFWKARITFRDGSQLHLFEFVIEKDGIIVDKYRYHYQNREEEMIFRFDDAAHHEEVETFPEHKHEENEIVASEKPNITTVFNLVADHISRE